MCRAWNEEARVEEDKETIILCEEWKEGYTPRCAPLLPIVVIHGCHYTVFFHKDSLLTSH
jgi:hypothetical protein